MEISTRKRTHVKHHKSMRGDPEGDSVLHSKQHKFVVPAPPNSENDTSIEKGISPKKRSRKAHEHYISVIKPKHKYLNDTDMSMGERSDTPDTLSQISAIAPVDDTQDPTYEQIKEPKGRMDTTWEQAVEHARGQPDGAEKSFHKKKLSKASLKVKLPEVSPEKEEEKAPVAVNNDGKLERRKSLKMQFKKATSKLKSLKSKKNLNDGKKKLDATLADETMTKKPSMKELPKKERKKVRKMMNNNYEMTQRSKKIWEDLRRHDLQPEKKKELCDELMEMVKGKIKQFCFAHDTARVVQCLIQHGTPEQKEHVFEELKDDICIMAKSKYAKFLVKKMLMYGSKHQKSLVFRNFHGNVRKLVRHAEAAEVVEYAYNEHASASQRLLLLEDFYGPSFALFRTPDILTLDQIMTSQPDKREMILRNMKEALLPLIDKNILLHSMVHKLFMEFFTYAGEKMRAEMVEALREGLIHMLHTRDGSRVAMFCVWHGTAKDRKVIIKSLKTHVLKICKEEYGHLVMLAIFDVVDDTKLVQKALLEEMLKSIQVMFADQYGRKVLLYALSPRDPLHFHPDIVRVLQEGDKNSTSKKEKSVRERELLEFFSQPLLQYVVDNARDLVLNNSSLLLVLSIITHAIGDPTAAMEAIAKIAGEPFVAGDTESPHIVENPAGHMTLKRLIQNDKDRMKAGAGVLFSEVLLRNLGEGSLKSWAACNRGCFTLVFLMELEHPEITKQVTSQLMGIRKSLKKMTFKGAQVLLQKLDMWT
ncbi:hypothetical protein ACJMK2_041986 [Sinanodonta woodiana]|uniref:PUM-HD domain-containing protein n=1 Tax=Sinanodonta woodiana TaxID=1069815 RepID=A0ABD3W7S4_SINWO